MTTPDFVDAVQRELSTRDWSVAKLAKRAEIDPSYLGRVLRRERTIGTEACRSIARALGKGENEYLALAGLAAPEPATDAPSLRELISKFSQLSDEDQEAVLKHVRALDEMQQAEKRRSLRLKPKAG